ncbi:NAD-P-binding protein [Calocera viscosa TUFC12733]|uniref:NAD-P-binding protein n=1 Tax=Calocera viscosa (strain TUFC12733) TaxID=1330018 RepID=A0A167QXL8_CALVF|nr:NAD-P-binding protein [Calocera viscosa TUFC12733]
MSDIDIFASNGQDLPVTERHDIYAGIQPSKFHGSLAGKVVFVTGASRGIGAATARAFAQSGASVFLAARKIATLEDVKNGIDKDFPGAKVAYYPTDVVKAEEVKAAVEECIKAFGKIDIVISNSGAAENIRTLAQAEPDNWWWTWEVNVRGNFNVTHYTLPHLVKTHGYLIYVTSVGAQYIMPGLSAYQSTKHVLNRLAEFVLAEHDGDVKVFSFHPGGVKTEMSEAAGPEILKYCIDDVQLPAWTMVRLVQGEEDYLSGRFVSANWDLDEVLSQWKEPIVRDDALKNKLTVPKELHRK